MERENIFIPYIVMDRYVHALRAFQVSAMRIFLRKRGGVYPAGMAGQWT